MPFNVVPIAGFTANIPVVHIGGSITQGTNVAAALRWVDLIGRHIGINTYHHITNYNAGIGGHNAWMDLVRLQTDLLAYSPSIVVIDCAVNNSGDIDKSTTEGLIRRIRTALPDAFILLVYFGNYPNFATNDVTNSAAANKVYLKLLAANYDIAEVDADEYLAALVGAGTCTVGQYTIDGPHPTAYGNTVVFDILKPTILNYFPIPATPQWTQDLADYDYLYDDGSYENTPIIRNATDSDAVSGTWAVVNTTQRQSTEANAALTWTGTFQSFGLDEAITGAVAWSIDGGEFTTINFSVYPIANMMLWSGARAEHTVVVKVVSGTVTIKRFLAI